MFSSQKKNTSIPEGNPYRSPQPSCSSLDLSSPSLDPLRFKDLIHCFNSNHSIDELSQWVDELPERELQGVTRWLNQAVLENPKNLYESRLTVKSLQKRGKLDSLLMQWGAIFKPSYLNLLTEDSFFSIFGSFQKLSHEEWFTLVQLLKKISLTPSFQELQKKWNQQNWSKKELRQLGQKIQTSFQDGALKEELQNWMRKDHELSFRSFLEHPQENLLWINALLQNEGASWKKLRQLSQVFSRPISCLGGEKTFNAPWENVLQELEVHSTQDSSFLEFNTRFAISSTVGVARDLCSLPESFFSSYPEYLRWVTSSGGEGFLSLFRNVVLEGDASFLWKWISRSPSELDEVLVELQNRGLLLDSALVFTQLDRRDRLFLMSLFENKELKKEMEKNWVDWIQVAFAFDAQDLSSILSAVEGFYVANPSHVWLEEFKKIDLRSLRDSKGKQNLDRVFYLFNQMSRDGRLESLLAGVFDLFASYAEKGNSGISSSEIQYIPGVPLHFLSSLDLPREGIEFPRKNLSESLRACLSVDLKKRGSDQEDVYFKCLEDIRDDPESRELTRDLSRLLGSVTLSNGRSLGELLISWGKAPPSGILPWVKGLLSQGKLSLWAGWVSPYFDGTESSYRWLGELSESLSHFRERNAAAFYGTLRGFSPFLKSKELLEWTKSRGIKTPQEESFDLPRIERWIQNKECEVEPNILAQRLKEVQEDYLFSISNWDRVDGKPRRSWSSVEWQERLAPVLHRLQDVEISQAISRFLSRRSNDRLGMIKWFSSRTQDKRLKSVFYPGDQYPHVQYLNSLDQLEILLNSSDFSYAFSDHFGLRFMKMIGESWGDEPFEKWPASIQRKYALGGRPPTLKETYLKIRKTLYRYISIGALPKLKGCEQFADPLDSPERQREETTDPSTWVSAPNRIIPHSIKANVFNLAQVLPVIEENLPGSGTSHAGGMILLRDLFFELSQVPDGLELVLDLNQLSFLRGIGYYFIHYSDPTWLALQERVLSQGDWVQNIWSMIELTLRDEKLKRNTSQAVQFFTQLFLSSNFEQFEKWDQAKMRASLLHWLSLRFQPSSTPTSSGGWQERSEIEMLLEVLEEKPESLRRVVYGACQGVDSLSIQEFLQILERHL